MFTLCIKHQANADATYALWNFLEKNLYVDPTNARDITLKEIQEFVQQGADLDAKTDCHHLTACMVAAKEGFIETAKAPSKI